jgi:hypothetical protein
MIFLALNDSFPRPENIISTLIGTVATLDWERSKLRALEYLNLIIGAIIIILLLAFLI